MMFYLLYYDVQHVTCQHALLSQENQEYYNQHDQQLIPCKHDGGSGYYNQSDQQFLVYKHNVGLEQVNTELIPSIVLEEKED